MVSAIDRRSRIAQSCTGDGVVLGYSLNFQALCVYDCEFYRCSSNSNRLRLYHRSDVERQVVCHGLPHMGVKEGSVASTMLQSLVSKQNRENY